MDVRGFSSTLEVESLDSGPASGPLIELYRNSASPANGDGLGSVDFYANNALAAKTITGRITGTFGNVASGAEESRLGFWTMDAGALSRRMEITEFEVKIERLEDRANLTLYCGLSPADFQWLSAIQTVAHNDIGENITWSRLVTTQQDISDGIEDADVRLYVMASGLLTQVQRWNEDGSRFFSNVEFDGAMLVGSATGGFQTSGSINAEAYFLNGTSLASVFQAASDRLSDVAALGDPNADSVLGWDDSTGAIEYLTASEGRAAMGLGSIATSGLTISTSTPSGGSPGDLWAQVDP